MRSCRWRSASGRAGTIRGSSELVKAHTPRRGRPGCRKSVSSIDTIGERALRKAPSPRRRTTPLLPRGPAQHRDGRIGEPVQGPTRSPHNRMRGGCTPRGARRRRVRKHNAARRASPARAAETPPNPRRSRRHQPAERSHPPEGNTPATRSGGIWPARSRRGRAGPPPAPARWAGLRSWPVAAAPLHGVFKLRREGGGGRASVT
jgi:hypothetical protein